MSVEDTADKGLGTVVRTGDARGEMGGGGFMRAKSGIWEVGGQSTGVRGNGCIDELIWWTCSE